MKKQQPAKATTPAPTQETLPDWAWTTPRDIVYHLEMEDPNRDEPSVERISLDRDEYVDLKHALATRRGYDQARQPGLKSGTQELTAPSGMDVLDFDQETGKHAYQSGAPYEEPPSIFARSSEHYRRLPRFTLTEWGPDDKTSGQDKALLTKSEARELMAHLHKIRERKPVKAAKQRKPARKSAGSREHTEAA